MTPHEVAVNEVLEDIVYKAKGLAIQWHGDQKYGDRPYVEHLFKVVHLVRNQGKLVEALAWLHDILEDTEITRAVLENELGDYIATAVTYLTDEPGKNRREKKEATYNKILLMPNEYDIILIVKAADRLANVKNTIATKNVGLLGMYQKEHDKFKSVFYKPGLCDFFWMQLDKLIKG